MKKEDIINTLKHIFDISTLKDLDLEVFPDVLPEQGNQIGMIFIRKDSIYLGATAGQPDYARIGKIDRLNDILYRLYEDDRVLQIVFDFEEYRVSLTHEEYKTNDISVYDSKAMKWELEGCDLISAPEIEDTIKRINDNDE